MLQSIQDILFSIGDFFKGIGDFISDFFSDLVQFKNLLDTSSDMGISLIEIEDLYPTYFTVSIVLLLSTLLLLRLMGRD